MKTHLSEEIEDFLSGIKISLFFLPILLFTLISPAQTTINGFIKAEQFKSGRDLIGITSVFIDKDDIPDFITIASDKKLYVHLSSKNYKIKSIPLRYNISKIKRTKRIFPSVTEFAFVSRKDKVCGTFQVNSIGGVLAFRAIRLDGNPDDFILSKNAQKAVLYGKNFNGLEFVDLRLSEKQRLHIAEGSLINSAIFYDVDNDFNTDIIYNDILSESLNFIKNENNFELINNKLSLGLNDISCLKRLDYNLDGFEDIIFVSDKGVEMFSGDSVTTFEDRELLVNDKNVKDFCVADFNIDGNNDVAYLKSEGESKQLHISFSVLGKLTQPVSYASNTSITKMNLTGLKNNQLVILDEDNVVTLLSRVDEIDQSSLKLGAEPTYLSVFKQKDNSSLINLAVIDSSDNKIKVYINALSTYYEIPLKAFQSKMKIINISDTEIYFIVYSNNTKLIEAVILDLTKGVVWSSQFYTQYNIDSIKLQKRMKTLPSIVAESVFNNNSYIENFEFKGFRYQKSEPEQESEVLARFKHSRVNEVSFANTDSTEVISIENNKLILRNMKLGDKVNPVKILKSKLKGPVAVEFVNKKNGYIFMIDKDNNLIDVSSFE